VLFGAAGVKAPTKFPRADLVVAFLTGVDGVNKNGSTAEMLRLNTKLPATAKGMQNSLGAAGCFVNGALMPMAAGCDVAGFPNGRRPGDDVVDIALRAVEGVLLPGHPAAVEQLTDGALSTATVAYTPEGAITGDATFSLFRTTFPYLQTPLSGSQGPTHP